MKVNHETLNHDHLVVTAESAFEFLEEVPNRQYVNTKDYQKVIDGLKRILNEYQMRKQAKEEEIENSVRFI